MSCRRGTINSLAPGRRKRLEQETCQIPDTLSEIKANEHRRRARQMVPLQWEPDCMESLLLQLMWKAADDCWLSEGLQVFVQLITILRNDC